MFRAPGNFSRDLIYPQIFFDFVDYFPQIFFALRGAFMHQVIDFFI